MRFEKLDPETGTGVEVGLKSRLRDGTVTLELDIFRMDLENLLVARDVGGLPALVNGGEQRLRGIDAGVECRLPHAMTLRAAFAWHAAVFGDFVRDFGGVPTQLSGKRLEMSARTLGSLGVRYGSERGFVAGFETGFTGKRWLNMRNTAPAAAFMTFAIHAGWRFSRFDLLVRAENLSDERAPVSESELGDAQYYLLPARTVRMTGTWRF